MSTLKPWLTLPQAALALGRSKRTLRRWLADPTNRIQVDSLAVPRTINTADLLRVEAAKSRYRDAPTFGRKPDANVSNVSAVR